MLNICVLPVENDSLSFIDLIIPYIVLRTEAFQDKYRQNAYD